MRNQVEVLEVSKVANNVIELLNANMPKVAGFMGIQEYTNRYNEVSKRTINLLTFQKAKDKDINDLENLSVVDMVQDVEAFNKAIKKALIGKVQINLDLSVVNLERIKAILVDELKNPNQKKRKAQIDAYTVVGNGLKVHNEQGSVHLFASEVPNSKEILVKGEYPTTPSGELKLTKSSELTNLKNTLKQYLNFRTLRYRSFKIDAETIIKTNGKVLTFSDEI